MQLDAAGVGEQFLFKIRYVIDIEQPADLNLPIVSAIVKESHFGVNQCFRIMVGIFLILNRNSGNNRTLSTKTCHD